MEHIENTVEYICDHSNTIWKETWVPRPTIEALRMAPPGSHSILLSQTLLSSSHSVSFLHLQCTGTNLTEASKSPYLAIPSHPLHCLELQTARFLPPKQMAFLSPSTLFYWTEIIQSHSYQVVKDYSAIHSPKTRRTFIYLIKKS